MEIFTYQELSDYFKFDPGWVSPDLEENYRDAFDGATADLHRAYLLVKDEFANIIEYRVTHDIHTDRSGLDYTGHVVGLSFTGCQELAAFRASRQLAFTVKLEDLPRDTWEVKVETVWLALVEAEAKNDLVQAMVRHSGIYSALRIDGTEADVVLQPHVAKIAAKATRLKAPGSPILNEKPDPKIDSWGLGVATSWLLYIEEAEMTAGRVDLTQFSEIQVWIACGTLVRSTPLRPEQAIADETVGVSPRTLVRRDQLGFREVDSGEVYVVRGDKKYLVRGEAPTGCEPIAVEAAYLDRFSHGGDWGAPDQRPGRTRPRGQGRLPSAGASQSRAGRARRP